MLSPLIILTGLVLILYFARAILIPLALALTLNFLLTPLVLFFQRLPIRRVPAVAMALLISVVALVAVGWVVARQVIQVANDLPKYRLNIHHKIEALHYPAESALGRATESLEEIGKEFTDSGTGPDTPVPELPGRAPLPGAQTAPQAKPAARRQGPFPVQVVAVPATGLAYLREALAPALVPLATTGMVLIFTVFILIKQEDLRDRFLRLAGVPQLHAMTLALDDAGRRISRYLIMQFLVNTCYGICFGVGLFFIGIPNATLWGVMAGLFRLVPYVGAPTAAAFPLVLAVATFNGWGPPVLVLLLFALLELIASNLVEPWLYGAHTGISSLALLVTTVFWTTIWGWAGLVLAVPLTVCVIVLGRYVPRMSFLHILLGDEKALSVEAQFYQRLLALDQEDARLITTTFLKTHSRLSLYDQVVVPALTLAEQDRHKGALDERRESFVFLSVSEIISELTVHGADEVPAKSRKLNLRWTQSSTPDLASSRAEPAVPGIRIFCLPANDKADEITSSMLAQLLESAGYGVLSLPVGSPFEEILTHLPPEPQDIICISALPPFAFAQASSLCQRVRLHLPQNKIIAGIWGFAGDLEKAKQRFGGTEPDQVVASLAAAIEQINEWRKFALIPDPMGSSDFDAAVSPGK
jgi:predicted PurR-regulated permease PerM